MRPKQLTPEQARWIGNMTDNEAAQRIGVSRKWIWRYRQRHHIPPYQPTYPIRHGENAGYARGCRCNPCVDAHRTRVREYARYRRAQKRDTTS